MKKSRFTEEQIIGFIRQAEAATPVKAGEAHGDCGHVGAVQPVQAPGLPPRGALPRSAPETEMNQALSAKIIEIAYVRRRFGYRRIHNLLRSEFAGVTHKRVLRLYQQANRKAKRPASERVPLQLARGVDEVWSMDFVSDSLASGRRIS